jgi:UDP-glucose:(heptosyl)LPS alpha-1,3-glucosyltransferase
MKIALVVHDLHEHGGHSLYTKVLADELSHRHEVTVFANRCERPPHSRWGFHQVRAWRASALASVHTFPLGVRALATKLADFEIRHMQGYCGGRPSVVTAHICVAAYLDSLRDISRRNRLSLEWMAAAESRFYRRYQGRIIAVSQKIARELREFYHVSDNNITVIPHGVDTDRFSGAGSALDPRSVRGSVGVREGQRLALYVGDLTKSHTYLKALAEATAPDIQFVIVTRSERYRWNASNVHFVPPTPEIERYYRAADAFVFPSVYDAFGMVVLEAMASGLAVFSSDCAGAAELIHHGRDGFVIPLAQWVEATADGLRDRALLQSVGRAAAETAARHDWQRVARAVEQVYFEAAAAERASETGMKAGRTCSV